MIPDITGYRGPISVFIEKIDFIKPKDEEKKIHGSWEKCLRSGFRTPVEGKRDRWGGYPPDWDQ
jgi:hypothetical protein